MTPVLTWVAAAAAAG
jgi:ankyrin repeat protein